MTDPTSYIIAIVNVISFGIMVAMIYAYRTIANQFNACIDRLKPSDASVIAKHRSFALPKFYIISTIAISVITTAVFIIHPYT